MSGGGGGSVETGDGGTCPRIIKRSESSILVDVKTEPRSPSPVCVAAKGSPQATKPLRSPADTGGGGGGSTGGGGSCSGGGGGSNNSSGGGGGGGSNDTEAKNKDGRHWRGIDRERRTNVRDSDRRSTHHHDHRRRRRRHDTPHRRTVRGAYRVDRRPHRSHGSSNITATHAYPSPFGTDRVHRHATRRRHRRHREHEPPRRPAVPKPVEDGDFDEEDPLDDSESTTPPRSLPMPNQTVPRRGFDKNPDSASATAGGNPPVPNPGAGVTGVTDPKTLRDTERRHTEDRVPRPRRSRSHSFGPRSSAEGRRFHRREHRDYPRSYTPYSYLSEDDQNDSLPEYSEHNGKHGDNSTMDYTSDSRTTSRYSSETRILDSDDVGTTAAGDDSRSLSTPREHVHPPADSPVRHERPHPPHRGSHHAGVVPRRVAAGGSCVRRPGARPVAVTRRPMKRKAAATRWRSVAQAKRARLARRGGDRRAPRRCVRDDPGTSRRRRRH